MEAFYYFFREADAVMFCFINSHHSILFDYFFLIVTNLGSGWVALPLVGAIIAIVTPRQYLVKALVCAAIAGTLAGTFNTQIKRLVDRPRPMTYFNKADTPTYTVHVVGKPLRRHSFPSGHTATAFAAATILAAFYRRLFFLAFIPALLVGWSRIYLGVHFPFDTLGGALLGSGVTLGVITFFASRSWLPAPLPIRRIRAQQ
jgi:membrane-associated phospholipid phosphatase